MIQAFSNKGLIEVFRKQKAVMAYLFGSQSKGRIGPLSDIDIAVYFDESAHANKRFDLGLEALGHLTDFFKTDEVNLVVLNDAPPLLTHRILREGILIYSANHKKRLEFEVKAILKYLDWKPYLDKFTQEVFG